MKLVAFGMAFLITTTVASTLEAQQRPRVNTWEIDAASAPNTSQVTRLSGIEHEVSESELLDSGDFIGSRGGRKGALIGGTLGLAVGYLAIKWYEYQTEMSCSSGCALIRLGGGVTMGAIIGGLIGGAVSTAPAQK